jgi:hypothetical protein
VVRPSDITIGRRMPLRAGDAIDTLQGRMRNCLMALMLVALPLVSGIAQAACLPTLGMNDCFRAEDPMVQAIEHRYLDVPRRDRVLARSKRHSHAKRLKVSPRSPSSAS